LDDYTQSTTSSATDIVLGDGVSTSTSYRVSLRTAVNTNFFSIRINAVSYTCSTYDTGQLKVGDIVTVFQDASDVYFAVNGVVVDSVTTTTPMIGNVLFNYGLYGYGAKVKCSSYKIWDLSAVLAADIDIDYLSNNAPTYWFKFAEYDNNATLPDTIIFHDAMGTGNIGTLTDGSSANISKCDGLSPNAEKGFNFDAVNTVTYIPASEATAGKDVLGNDLVYTSADNSALSNSEQGLQFPEVPELIDLAVTFDDGDSNETDMFDESGNANTIYSEDLRGVNAPNNVTVQTRADLVETIKDLQIKES
jgi:hypothetical protein